MDYEKLSLIVKQLSNIVTHTFGVKFKNIEEPSDIELCYILEISKKIPSYVEIIVFLRNLLNINTPCSWYEIKTELSNKYFMLVLILLKLKKNNNEINNENDNLRKENEMLRSDKISLLDKNKKLYRDNCELQQCLSVVNELIPSEYVDCYNELYSDNSKKRKLVQ